MITELAVMEECSSAKRFKLSNKDLNPALEMLVNDFDDERTLDEEEALESNEDPLAELSSLQKQTCFMTIVTFSVLSGNFDFFLKCCPTAKKMRRSS